MRSLGVDLVNVSMGNPYASPHLIRPFEYPPPDGYETPEHPLIGVDRHFRLTETIQRASPPLPDFGRLLMQTGKLDRKRVCRTFSYCTALMRSKHNELGQFATGCPPFDKEAYGPLWEQARTRMKDEG
jgi:hypothetical protein